MPVGEMQWTGYGLSDMMIQDAGMISNRIGIKKGMV